MASLSQSIETVSGTTHLRKFDTQRDLVQVADLIELCFDDSLDAENRRFLQRMRSYAAQPRILRWSASAEWNGIPLTGFVWEEDGKLVGNASLIPYRLQGKRLYLIANVAVHPAYRRRGIARQLTARAISYAEGKGAPSVWLHVRQENEVAYQLYRDQGFIERARRSTWVSEGEAPGLVPTPGTKITHSRVHDWEIQRSWLTKDYPPELSWHLSFDPQAFHPGLPGGIRRFFKQILLEQWSAYREKQWQGSLAVQFTPAYTQLLWLSLPAQIEEDLVRALLMYARGKLRHNRQLTLDYPAGKFDAAIQSAGFSNRHTLVWMELPLIQ